MNKTTIRLPEHIHEALAQEAARNNVSFSATVRVTLAKALGLPLGRGDCRAFEVPASSVVARTRTIMVPFHLVEKVKEQIRQGYFIGAIKALRSDLDLSLYEAKFLGDLLRDEGN